MKKIMLEPKNVEILRVLDDLALVLFVFITFFFKDDFSEFIFTGLLGFIFLISSFVINHKSSFYSRLVGGCIVFGVSFMQLLKIM